MAHPMLGKVETGLHTVGRLADAAGTAYKIGKGLWQVGSTVLPLLAALLL